MATRAQNPCALHRKLPVLAQEGEYGAAAALAVTQIELERLADDRVADCRDIHGVVRQVAA